LAPEGEEKGKCGARAEPLKRGRAASGRRPPAPTGAGEPPSPSPTPNPEPTPGEVSPTRMKCQASVTSDVGMRPRSVPAPTLQAPPPRPLPPPTCPLPRPPPPTLLPRHFPAPLLLSPSLTPTFDVSLGCFKRVRQDILPSCPPPFPPVFIRARPSALSSALAPQAPPFYFPSLTKLHFFTSFDGTTLRQQP